MFLIAQVHINRSCVPWVHTYFLWCVRYGSFYELVHMFIPALLRLRCSSLYFIPCRLSYDLMDSDLRLHSCGVLTYPFVVFV